MQPPQAVRFALSASTRLCPSSPACACFPPPVQTCCWTWAPCRSWTGGCRRWSCPWRRSQASCSSPRPWATRRRPRRSRRWAPSMAPTRSAARRRRRPARVSWSSSSRPTRGAPATRALAQAFSSGIPNDQGGGARSFVRRARPHVAASLHRITDTNRTAWPPVPRCGARRRQAAAAAPLPPARHCGARAPAPIKQPLPTPCSVCDPHLLLA